MRVNARVPGNVTTPLCRNLLGVPCDGLLEEPAPIPMRRAAEPAEAAAFVVYLLSDESAFITGAAPAIGGGFTAGQLRRDVALDPVVEL